MPNVTCKKCDFYVRYPEPHPKTNEEEGSCNRWPKKLATEGYSAQMSPTPLVDDFPTVFATDFCGEFQPIGFLDAKFPGV